MPNTEKVISKESVKPYIEKYEASTDDVVGVDRLWLLDLLKEVSFHRFQDMRRRQKRKEKRLAVAKRQGVRGGNELPTK